MDFSILFRALLTIICILAILGFIFYSYRKWLAIKLNITHAKECKRLQIVEIMPLGIKHELILVKRDNTEHLLLVDDHKTTIVEKEITPPATS